MTNLDEVIDRLKVVNERCKSAQYSLTDVNEINVIIEELKKQRQEIARCCY